MYPFTTNSLQQDIIRTSRFVDIAVEHKRKDFLWVKRALRVQHQDKMYDVLNLQSAACSFSGYRKFGLVTRTQRGLIHVAEQQNRRFGILKPYCY